MISKLKDITMIREVLHEAMTGLWIIEIEAEKAPRMYADHTMLELLGFDIEPSPEECYEVWNKNIFPEYRPLITQCIDEMLMTGRAEVQYSWLHPKLGKIFVRCGGVPDFNYKSGICLRGYHQNVTDTIILRQEKEKLEELNQEIIGSLHNLFFSVFYLNLESNLIKPIRVPDNNILSLDKDFPYQDFLFDYAPKLFHPDDCVNLHKDFSIEHFHSLIQNGTNQFTREYRCKFDKEYRWVSCTIYFGEQRKNSNGAIIALQDIHEQKQKEEENRSALINAYHIAQSANHAKSDFLSKMSHDLRTPINAIIGMTTLASYSIDNKEKIADCLKKIISSSNLLLNLVNEVLDMSTIESGNFKLNKTSFSLSELLANVTSIIHSAIEEKEQSFELETKNLIHVNVIGDVPRLEQILLNILTNANKYTPQKGTIHLSLEELPSEKLNIGRYCFICEDNGIGMSDELLKHIYEPFTRADDSRISTISGTGLGMTITKNLVQMMEGTIQVESKLSKGSRFIIILEFHLSEEKEMPKITIDISSLHLEGKHLLLAEDNALNLEIAKEFLEMSGAEVDIVINGKEAVVCFENSPPNYYDAIFLDIQMPIMNGNEAASAIRSLSREDACFIPIIALTANAFTEDILRSKQAGMNEHLTKPLQLDQLALVLKKWVKKEPL